MNDSSSPRLQVFWSRSTFAVWSSSFGSWYLACIWKLNSSISSLILRLTIFYRSLLGEKLPVTESLFMSCNISENKTWKENLNALKKFGRSLTILFWLIFVLWLLQLNALIRCSTGERYVLKKPIIWGWKLNCLMDPFRSHPRQFFTTSAGLLIQLHFYRLITTFIFSNFVKLQSYSFQMVFGVYLKASSFSSLILKLTAALSDFAYLWSFIVP